MKNNSHRNIVLIMLTIFSTHLSAASNALNTTKPLGKNSDSKAVTSISKNQTTARKQLDQFTFKLNTLQSSFEQFLFRSDGNLAEQSSGIVALQTPRLLRWEYLKPYQQQIVADGSNIWIYDLDLEQVTVRRQIDEEMNSPLSVLIDPSQLDRDYTSSEDGLRDGLRWLKLLPKSKDAVFKTALIGLNSTGPMRIVVVDGLKQKTEWRFAVWKRNSILKQSTFKFTPPVGVDVVGETVSQAEVVPLKD